MLLEGLETVEMSKLDSNSAKKGEKKTKFALKNVENSEEAKFDSKIDG